MIEMLGVLAIVGVLSIGGIAGYSKAMYNHKLNKQREQYSQIFAGFYQNEENLRQVDHSRFEYRTPLLYALDIIPRDMQKGSSNIYLYDVFNNQSYIVSNEYGYVFATNLGDRPFDQCRTILEAIAPYHEFLAVIQLYAPGVNNSAYEQRGDKICTDGLKNSGRCIKDITPVRMERICSSCRNGCMFEIYLIYWW